MSDEKPIYRMFDLTSTTHAPAWVPQLAQAIRQIVREELTATKQHQHKTSMRRFTFPWGDSHVEGVMFSHPELVAYRNGGIYDFCGSIGAMCAKFNILEADILWIDEAPL